MLHDSKRYKPSFNNITGDSFSNGFFDVAFMPIAIFVSLTKIYWSYSQSYQSLEKIYPSGKTSQ